jgi:hypothetical protein
MLKVTEKMDIMVKDKPSLKTLLIVIGLKY